MRPTLLFYRCIRPTQYITDINTDQYSKVDSFFRDFSHDKSHPGLIRTFLESHDFERRLREDLTYVLRQFSEPDSARTSPDLGPAHSDLGFTRLYLPVNNDDRNRSKQEALQTATEIRLLAHTGQSYLSSVGPRFRRELVERLRNGARFRAILLNPWTQTGISIAIGERFGGCDQFSDMTTRIGDPIHLIETSIWYSKLEATRTGYRPLAEGFGENCDVRFCDSEIPATILITDTVAYYEPYLHVNLKERLDQSMLTFEVEVSKTSHIYRHSGAFFELLWQTSIPFTKFRS